MITADDALRTARAYLESKFPDKDLVIARTLERPIGWGVVYQTRKFMLTRNPYDMLVGPGPLLVLRQDGTVVMLRTFQSLEEEMTDYARSTGRSA